MTWFLLVGVPVIVGLIGFAVGYAMATMTPVFHRHRYEPVIIGHYDSLTGPRTNVRGVCACGRRRSWTVRGTITNPYLI